MPEWLKVAEGIAPVLIACYVAFIGTFQWRTAQEKLRLDLYNRRFEIYVQAITFMQALMTWSEVAETDRLQKRSSFVRAVRESRFLFASEPAVLELLEDLYNRSFVVTRFWERSTPLAEAMPDEYVEDYEEKQRQIEWLMEFTGKLEPLLVPFLAFHQRGLNSGEVSRN